MKSYASLCMVMHAWHDYVRLCMITHDCACSCIVVHTYLGGALKDFKFCIRDGDAYSKWLSENSPTHFDSAAEFHAFLATAQQRFADMRSCRERSRNREPPAIKVTRDQLRASRDEPSRQQLQALLKQQKNCSSNP